MSRVERPLVATQEPSESFTNNKNKIESEIPDKSEAEISARPRPKSPQDRGQNLRKTEAEISARPRPSEAESNLHFSNTLTQNTG